MKQAKLEKFVMLYAEVENSKQILINFKGGDNHLFCSNSK